MNEYETYQINFNDGTNALLVISEDEKPADMAVELCEIEGWNADDIVSIVKINE